MQRIVALHTNAHARTHTRMHAHRTQVFLCEQLLYNKQDLDKHMRTGDDEGPMAESGFKARARVVYACSYCVRALAVHACSCCARAFAGRVLLKAA